jgi:hypothetical protein
VTVGWLSEPPGAIVNVAGIRAFSGGVPLVVAGAAGFVVVSVPDGGVPVAVSDEVGGAVCVSRAVPEDPAVVVAVVVDWLCDLDVPHPTAVMSGKTHKRTASSLTFAG